MGLMTLDTEQADKKGFANMTQQEILSTFRTLLHTDQINLAYSMLNELAKANTPAIDEETRILLDARIRSADEHPEQLIPAEEVFAEFTSKQ